MLVNVLGARRDISFEDEKGRPISGCKVFWAFEETGVVGQMAEGKFFKSDSPLYVKALALEPGDIVNLAYGRNGRIDDILPV